MSHKRVQENRKRRNPVAHFANDFNKAATHVDRKKQDKRGGKVKHKKGVHHYG